jgi:hypothetical protein
MNVECDDRNHKEYNMADKDLSFSSRQYARDGGCVDDGVFLHIGDTSIRFDNPDQMERFADQVKAMMPEIRETYDRG